MVKKEILAKDIEIKAPVTIEEGKTVPEAADLMLRYNSSYLLVVNNDFKPTGIVTEKDFMIIVAKDRACHDMPIEEVASKPLITASLYSTIDECSDILKRNGIKHLPVTDENGVLHGVITWKELYVRDPGVVVDTHPIALFVISKILGLLLFEYSFSSTKKIISGDLFSGAISSFDSMFKELLNDPEGNLKFVEIEDNAFLFEHGKFTIAILVQDQESIDSRKRLKLFERGFEEKFSTHLENYSQKTPINIFEEATAIVEELFSASIDR
ncbi:MAG TPA: CBS domain-containing protein [Candidatus Lokiarchaeia archaeon]|nr:CBS domain-containing protein [Candidatus Lokiarchaeia archaeon]